MFHILSISKEDEHRFGIECSCRTDQMRKERRIRYTAGRTPRHSAWNKQPLIRNIERNPATIPSALGLLGGINDDGRIGSRHRYLHHVEAESEWLVVITPPASMVVSRHVPEWLIHAGPVEDGGTAPNDGQETLSNPLFQHRVSSNR
jgi:hypothetical protein